MLRIAFATGTEPGKWFSRFREASATPLETIAADDALGAVLDGTAAVALTRLPMPPLQDPRVDETFHVVRLYEEAPGIAVPKDSVFAELGEDVEWAEVADEILNYEIPSTGLADAAAVRDALQIVAANVGIVIAPRPLLKVLAKKQVVPLGLVKEDVARTEIAVVWRKADDCDDIQDFVGITRGRMPHSSRGKDVKLSAREKSLAKNARRAAAAKTGKKPVSGRSQRNTGRRKGRK